MHRRLSTLLLAAAMVVVAVPAIAASPRVGVIRDAVWSPGDAAREGAAEMEILLQLAALQQESPSVGLVGVGDRRGRFQDGTQRGLRFAASQGVPVVRLGGVSRTRAESDPDGFIDGGAVPAEAAAEILAKCLERLGPLPAEESQRHKVLALYQAAFTARQPAAVALR